MAYIIRKMHKKTGRHAGYLKCAHDYRQTVIFDETEIRLAKIIADGMTETTEFFHIVDLHESWDCAADLMIHA